VFGGGFGFCGGWGGGGWGVGPWKRNMTSIEVMTTREKKVKKGTCACRANVQKKSIRKGGKRIRQGQSWKRTLRKCILKRKALEKRINKRGRSRKKALGEQNQESLLDNLETWGTEETR